MQEAANEETIRGWLLRVRDGQIMWAHYVHELIHSGYIRFSSDENRYVLTVKGEKLLATNGG